MIGILVSEDIELPVGLLLALVWLGGDIFDEKSGMADMADGESQPLVRTSINNSEKKL